MKKYIVEVHEKNDNFADGTIIWKNESGQLHREGGPAVQQTDGFRGWWINDELHREDGPACEFPDGTRLWYLNDKLHREDGPAAEYIGGEYIGSRREWYINGKLLTEEEFNNRNKKELTITEIEKLLGYSVKIVKG